MNRNHVNHAIIQWRFQILQGLIVFFGIQIISNPHMAFQLENFKVSAADV